MVGTAVRSFRFGGTICELVEDGWLPALAVQCPNLTSLDLSGCSRVTGQGVRVAFSQVRLFVRLYISFHFS